MTNLHQIELSELPNLDAVPVPWDMSIAPLSVRATLRPSVLSVTVAGSEVGKLRRATPQKPWSELPLSSAIHRIKVVQICYPRRRYRTMVFVDGANVVDGRSEAHWRALCPPPQDMFATLFVSSRFGGWFGPLVIGTGTAAPGVVAWLQDRNPEWLLLGAIGFGIAFGWGSIVWGLARWLANRSTWPAGIRLAIVVFALICIPVVVILLISRAR